MYIIVEAVAAAHRDSLGPLRRVSETHPRRKVPGLLGVQLARYESLAGNEVRQDTLVVVHHSVIVVTYTVVNAELWADLECIVHPEIARIDLIDRLRRSTIHSRPARIARLSRQKIGQRFTKVRHAGVRRPGASRAVEIECAT